MTSPIKAATVAALAVMMPALPAIATEQETILIVDGSGSMWGKFDKQHKIVTIRKVLPKQLLPYDGKGNLGILAYGHRRKSNCRDIELIVPVSKVSSSLHGKRLARLSARGKTPITGALKATYNSFGKSTKIKRIILLADGPENCRADPCKYISGLVKEDKGLTAHVIAYGMGKRDAERLQCISTLTKGTFFRPKDREQLGLVLADLFASTLEPQWKTVVKKEPVKKIVPGLFLKAYLGNRGLPLKKDIKWLVYRNEKDARNNIAPLHSLDTAEPVLKLESGQYFIQLARGRMGSGKSVTVDSAAHQDVAFRLNAGILAVTLNAQEKFLQNVKDIRLSLLPLKKGSDAVPYATSQKSKASFTLPAGDYMLVSQLKNNRHEQRVSLKAGDRKTVTIPLDVGLLSLEARQSYEGRKVTSISYRIMRKKDNGGDSFGEYSRLASASPTIVLPTGTYYVEARSDLAVAIENFQVTAGQARTLSLNLNAGRITLGSRLAGGKAFANGEIHYRINQSNLSAMESQQALLETSVTGQQLYLPVGSYTVSSSAGNGGSYLEKDIVIGVGQSQKVEFVHKAGQVSLVCVGKNGKQVRRNLFWHITNTGGQTVARSTLASPKLLLEQGKYTARVLYHGKKFMSRFTVSATARTGKVRLVVR